MLAVYRAMALLRGPATKHLNGSVVFFFLISSRQYTVVEDKVETLTAEWTQRLFRA